MLRDLAELQLLKNSFAGESLISFEYIISSFSLFCNPNSFIRLSRYSALSLTSVLMSLAVVSNMKLMC